MNRLFNLATLHPCLLGCMVGVHGQNLGQHVFKPINLAPLHLKSNFYIYTREKITLYYAISHIIFFYHRVFKTLFLTCKDARKFV